jgi:L-histidine N-alpha-methyltransferase
VPLPKADIIPRYQVLLQHVPSPEADRQDLLAGLCGPRPFIASKFFYDSLGSQLFAAITVLDEYYLTRSETAIMAASVSEMASTFGSQGCTIVDLGAGDCVKASRLFTAFKPQQYVAVDISAQYLRQSLEGLQARFPEVPMLGIVADFTRALSFSAVAPASPRLFHYPGSSIGNFTPSEAQTFLSMLCARIDELGGLLIGVDLVKDVVTLESAYDDALGVTAAFNLNALRNANRIAGTDFAVTDWRHVSTFNAVHNRIEMHVEARHAIELTWPGGRRTFMAGDRIHTENSYKYREADFAALLERAGFAVEAAWTDEREWFAVFLARPARLP